MILEFQNVTAGYDTTTVLRDLSFSIPAGQVVACIGANGVGKTTTLRVAAGLLKPISGQVLLGGREATGWAPHERVAAGLCLIPEGRGIFRSLTVAENLRLQQPAWVKGNEQLSAALEAFPILSARMNQVAGNLSGGQQQMLALARAWLSSPKVVLLDEVSMGLAPIMVDTLFEALRKLSVAGGALFLVEQYVARAIALADLVLVLTRNGVAYFGPPAALDEVDLIETYLGREG